MSIDINELRSLSVSEKLRIVEILWDDIGESSEPITISDWQRKEVVRRREEMLNDPDMGLDHQQVWDRIRADHG
jgi:putative addiction module component (TIGR02574 family)